MTNDPLEAMNRVKESLDAPARLVLKPIVLFEGETNEDGTPKSLGDVTIHVMGGTNRQALSVLRRLGEDEGAVFQEFAVTEAFKNFQKIEENTDESEIFDIIQTEEFQGFFHADEEQVIIDLSVDVALSMNVEEEQLVEIHIEAPSYNAAIIGFNEVTADEHLTKILKEIIGV